MSGPASDARTAFASDAAGAQIIRFPATAIAWARAPADHVALIDSRGNVRRYRSEGDLHADILARNADVAAQAEAIVAEAREIFRKEAFEAGHWLSRLQFLIAGATRRQIIAATTLAALPLMVGVSAFIMVWSLRLLDTVKP
jgi:hypothetical protein